LCKLSGGDGVERGDDRAGLAGGDKVELIAVGDHANLGWDGGCHAVAGRCGGGGWGRWVDADDGDAGVGVCPEAGAGGAGGGVPG